MSVTTAGPADDEKDETSPTPDDVIAEAVAAEQNSRNWLRVLTAFVRAPLQQQGRYRPQYSVSTADDMSVRVKFALDQAVIAACERIGRICRSDVRGDNDGGLNAAPFNPAAQLPPAARPRNPQDN